MLAKLLISIFFLAILMQSALAIDTNAKNATLQMTTTLENGDTELQFNYAENINDGRGITFGCIGFCTGTYDGNKLIKYYTTLNQNNTLAKYIPALDAIDAGSHIAAGGDGNPSVAGLSGFIIDVHNCKDPLFAQAQLYELDQFYWNPAVSMWNSIGASNALTLAYIYDMCIRHGTSGTLNIINQTTSALGGTPKDGIDENTYLSKMFTIRDAVLKNENLSDINRNAGYKTLLESGNVNLKTPFTFKTYSDSFTINGDLGMSIDVTLTKKDLPMAEFCTSIINSSNPLSIKFIDSSQNATEWNWNFGDGAISTEQNPTHNYSTAGNYNINLTVSNENGKDSKTLNITVQEGSNSNSESTRSDHNSNGGGGGAVGSPEPQSNVESKELSQVYITNEKSAEFKFTKNVTPVVYVSLDSKKTAGRTTTIVEVLRGKSTLVSELPSYEVYKSINIWVGSSGFAIPENIENAVICFKVEKAWIQDKNIYQSSITLNRYSNGKWNPLSTNQTGEDNAYLYFIAKTPEFSSFAITGKTAAKETVTEIQPNQNTQILEQIQSPNTSGKESTKAPGYEVLYGILCLFSVFLHKKKRNE
jgi:PGF-pre-PGF domain-containing protein